jgi:hypothetical protein
MNPTVSAATTSLPDFSRSLRAIGFKRGEKFIGNVNVAAGQRVKQR